MPSKNRNWENNKSADFEMEMARIECIFEVLKKKIYSSN
jgi:hypothetical protein